MTTKPEALRLADKYEVEGFVGEHRFAQNEWCRQAAVELRRLHAQVQELEAQLEAVGAGGVEPLRRRDHFRDATEMVPLTESAIQAARTADYDVEDAPENWAFALGVRFAERAHGITQEQK